MKSATVLALILGAAAQVTPQALEKEFHAFMRKYHKRYSDAAEKKIRFQAFVDNFNLVEAHNSLVGTSFTLGINEFADMTADEFGLTHLGLASSSTQAQWDGLPYLGGHRVSNSTLPSSVDWRTKGAVTPVKNQGQCGSCWAFSTTGSLEGAWKIANGKLVSLSEQQLVDCSTSFGNQGCSGGLMDNGFKYAEQADMCTEASYPYSAKNGICKAASCSTGIPKGSVAGYKDVDRSDTQALMDAVAQQPVSVAIEADRSVFQLYRGGVLSATCGTSLDHGVLIVGYGTDSGKDYWLVKNSWGPSWGEAGYVRLLRGKPGVGECGIKSQPSYPVMRSTGLEVAHEASSSHYEKPPCRSDEVEAQVQGAGGQLCAPACENSSCPADMPAGTTAKPQCVLQDSASGKKYCALTCVKGDACPKGAKCSRVSGLLGVCVYPAQERSSSTLPLQMSIGQDTINI